MKIELTDIPFYPDIDRLCEKLHLARGSSLAIEIEQLAADAQQHAKPKAIIKLGFIDGRGEDYVTVDGIRFTSRVLAVNLALVQRVFAYVATCGHELDQWSAPFTSALDAYLADAVKEHALRTATEAVKHEIKKRFKPGTMSSMHPGSLQDWPLDEQRQLFSLLENPEQTIGVRLTPQLLMVPTKSVSGIRFASDVDFSSCQLCPREGCDERRAPYDPALFDRRYNKNL